ncbi:MAG: M42 family peptidase, partial [Oscillospiraceae bacterium]|nr:M42 family peptidase [Oscillospiraceae bacterium]
PYDCVFTFVVQEEVGLRGSRTAAYSVDPDFAIVLEATTAADIPLASGEKRCCELGKGAVVSHMDRSTIYDKELYRLSREIASENGIGWQTKTMVAGGNDSGAIHISRGGVRTIAISAPCRYLHSPSCVVKLSDLEDCEKLARLMLEKMCTM